jgi:predicted metal-dependent phosphoesterase TrpH
LHARTVVIDTPEVDLHAHSTASDGTLRPAELMRLAHARGLHAIALTDHDTLAGIDEAAREAAASGSRSCPASR